MTAAKRTGAHDYTAEAFAKAARARLGGEHVRPVGDHAINPALTGHLEAIARTPAAVLVPVVRGAEARVILTLRTDHLPSHAGQIAFPGGKIDPDDAGVEAAALREAGEEIGLRADDVELVTRAPDYLTGSGYRIAPVVALIPPDYPFRINHEEVREIFEVPLAFVMDLGNYRINEIAWKGGMRRFYEISHGGRRIWGITAGILRVLSEQVYGEAGRRRPGAGGPA